MNYQKIANLALRYGLALTYVFSGYGLIAHPASWVSFVPAWLSNLLPFDVLTFLQLQGAVELALALAFVTGYFLRPAAFISALEMVGIMLFYGLDGVVFRDLAILGGSLAVFFSTFAPKTADAAAPQPTEQSAPAKPNLTDSQRKLRIILVISAFILFSIILVGLFWLSNTTKDQAGWLAFSYATGLSMIVLPCTLPLAFVIVPLAMGKDPKKGLAIAFAFAVGVTITLSIYGALIAKLGQVVGLDRAKDTMYLIAGVFAVVFGFGELGLIKLRVPTYSGAFPTFIQNRKDVLKGLLLGLLLGNVGLGCPNPAFYVLLSHIATVGSMATGWFLTFIHAVGRVTPLLLLAILAVLGVDALSVLMKRREALTRITAWGVVGVGAFILVFGLLGHDWYVYSGIHSLLETVTQEAAFVTSYAEQFGGLAHAHELPTGPYLKYGSWLMVTLIAVPMIWNWRRKKKEIDQANPDQVRAWKWFGAYTVTAVILLYTVFAVTIPSWYRYQVAPGHMMDDHAHGAEGSPHDHGAMTPEESGAEIKLDVQTRRTAQGTLATLNFEVIDYVTKLPQTSLEISHGEPMHIVGARKGDLEQFFHIHPRVEGSRFVAEHLFEEPGTYSVWPGIVYRGAHVTQKMPDLVIEQAAEPAAQPNFDRVKRLGDDLVVTLKAAPQLYAGTDHNIGFAITDAGGFDIPLGKYLEENMHINIISPDTAHYHHLHTNYGMIGTDGHGGPGGEHMHGQAPSGLGFALIPKAQAQAADGHTDHAHGPVGAGEDQVVFNDKDMRILFNFPQAGLYRIFAEFVEADNPGQVRMADFWVEVGEPLPPEGLPKWLLIILSGGLIAAVMPVIFRYLNEEKIKV